ncbi:MAG: hypothetical protein IJM38_07905 [Ruminococcus sp.]|nr:hypothetical protein [Ruminococcus sp.]
MKNKKTLISAIAAASVLSVATSVSAFASNQAAKNEKKQAENTTAVEETVIEETTDAAEIVEETTAAETEKPELPAPTEEELPAPEVKDEDSEEAPAPEVKDEDEAEAPAEEIAKPVKPIGVKEIKDMIVKSFDFDNSDFKDDDAKKDWFDFCTNGIKFDDKKPAELVKPEDAEAPAKPEAEPPVKPEAPVVDENAEKPEPPTPPVKDENAPAPEAPAAPEKPEIKPHEHKAPHHGPHKDIENTQVEDTTEAAEETVEEN